MNKSGGSPRHSAQGSHKVQHVMMLWMNALEAAGDHINKVFTQRKNDIKWKRACTACVMTAPLT